MSGVVWRDAWPRAIANFVAASKATGARMVLIDNLYMYGPQTEPLVETMLARRLRLEARGALGRDPRLDGGGGRGRGAHRRAARARTSTGPASDSPISATPRSATSPRGKPAVFIGSPDVLHDYAYVPDIARAATTLLAAPDSAFGQAWHAPCAPTRTTRDILKIAAEALGVRLRISAMPAWMLGASAMFSPFLRELTEMRFQWDRPYHVDASRFAAAFWSDPTPFETGVRETALCVPSPASEGEALRARPGCAVLGNYLS